MPEARAEHQLDGARAPDSMVTKNGDLLLPVDRIETIRKLSEGNKRSPDIRVLVFERLAHVEDEYPFLPVETLLQFFYGDGRCNRFNHTLLVLFPLGILLAFITAGWCMLFGRVALLTFSFLMSDPGLAQNEPVDQTSPARFKFLPGSLRVPPLVANYQEPRVGLRKQVGSSRMKLDIGSTLDLAGYLLTSDGRQQLRLGADFFTYALTTSSQGLRLQVDAVDGVFGGHIVFDSRGESTETACRLRLLHLSAHFLDGHFDPGTDTWKDGREPIPFTRDFGELLGSHRWTGRTFILRVYAGFSYATLVRPDNLQRWGGLCGAEISSQSIIGPVFEQPTSLYIADHFSLAGIPQYIGTNNLEGGMKFGAWDGTGIRLYVNYYRGLEIFSQYYDLRVESWGIGFALDFW